MKELLEQIKEEFKNPRHLTPQDSEPYYQGLCYVVHVLEREDAITINEFREFNDYWKEYAMRRTNFFTGGDFETGDQDNGGDFGGVF